MTNTIQSRRQRAVYTSKVLRRMLTENTGRALCDSGDHYGRNWQLNQGRDFDAEPAGWLSAYLFEHGGETRLDLRASLSVYHWLAERVQYNAKLQRKFTAFLKREDLYPDLEGMEKFVDSIGATGLYNDGEPVTVNTYNGEDCLSQVLQYVYFEDDDGSHVLLQIHGGCDVRGGYTDTVCFDVFDETSIFDNARICLGCADCPQRWESCDGGYSFEDSDGTIDFGSLVPTDTKPDYMVPSVDQTAIVEDIAANQARSTGLLWIDENRKPHCPCCGGLLEAY